MNRTMMHGSMNINYIDCRIVHLLVLPEFSYVKVHGMNDVKDPCIKFMNILCQGFIVSVRFSHTYVQK